jgi:hypothetical protein
MEAKCWAVSKLHNITTWKDVLIILIAVESSVLHEKCLFKALEVKHSTRILGSAQRKPEICRLGQNRRCFRQSCFPFGIFDLVNISWFCLLNCMLRQSVGWCEKIHI